MAWRKPLSLEKTFLSATIMLPSSLGTIFSRKWLNQDVATAEAKEKGATLSLVTVKDPERFGVVEFDADMNAISIEETRTSEIKLAVIVLLYDNDVVEIAKNIKPSPRGA